MNAKRGRPRLDSLSDTRSVGMELRELYRLCRDGRMPIDDGLKLSRILRVLMEVYALTDIESRLKQLETVDNGKIAPNVLCSTAPIARLAKKW